MKFLLMLLLTLAVVWYVAGMLDAAPQEHAPRPPVILRDAMPPSESPASSDDEPSDEHHQRRADHGQRRGDDGKPRDEGPGIKVVTQSPSRLGHDGPADTRTGGRERDDDDKTEAGDD